MIGLILATIGLSAVLTVIARRVGIRVGLLDLPDDERKQHDEPVPALGGIAFFTAIALVLGALSLLDSDFAASLSGFPTALLVTSAAVWCLGVIDDIWPVRAKHKLAVQLIASIVCIAWVNPVANLHVINEFETTSKIATTAFCVFWLVACSNAVNLLDGMDGMAALQGIIGFSTLAAIAALSGNPTAATICLILTAGIVGFAIFNAPPATIFMGDAGSMTLGYLLGGLTLYACLDIHGKLSLTIPLAVVIIPAFDTTLAIVRRILNGNGISAPDREHFHHYLLDTRGSIWKALAIVLAMNGSCAAAAVAARWVGDGSIAAAVCAVVLITSVATRTFGHRELAALLERLAPAVPSTEATAETLALTDDARDVIPLASILEDRAAAAANADSDDESELGRAA